MHLYSRDEARIAQQRVLQLPEPQFQIALAIAFVQHHLLRVVRPALGVGTAAEQLADLGGRARDPHELRVVARVHLMHRRADDGPAIEALQIIFGLLGSPTSSREA